MRLLFVCNQNKNRSKTAKEIFASRFETRSAGLYSDSPLKNTDLAWADLVIVMEEGQRSEIGKRFPKEYLSKKIINLDIPDIYQYNQSELTQILRERLCQSL